LSYLALDRRADAGFSVGAARIIGRPRVYKAHALLLGCDEAGLRESRLNKRRDPGLFRRMRKGQLGTLVNWKVQDAEALELTEKA
jgi:hypothetical protein